MGIAMSNTEGLRRASASSRSVRSRITTFRSSGERVWLLTGTRGPAGTGRVERKRMYSTTLALASKRFRA